MPAQPDLSTPPAHIRMNQPVIQLMLLEPPCCKVRGYCIYLQYPLAADVLICPICSPPRSFHLLGGVTRHLKRCHSKLVAFSCALCSLPFEMQKQCKTHQVACRKRLKGTTQSPAPAPSPPAACRPTAPEPQQRTAIVQAATRKRAPVARPVQWGAVIEKVPAAAGNTTQVLASRR
ncbi:unnamed protein product, partial [Caretta caretta]